MSDASKRATPADAGVLDPYEFVELHTSPGVKGDGYHDKSKDFKNSKAPEFKCTLPPGVASVQAWGETVCTLPKYKSLGMSYSELAADSGKAQYLKWVTENAGKSSKMQDLVNHLNAVGWKASTESDVIPGTSEPRVCLRENEEAA